MSLITTDDRLDALALVRAHMDRDGDAVQVINEHSGQGMYLAVLQLAAELIEAQSEGDPQTFLTNIADGIRAETTEQE